MIKILIIEDDPLMVRMYEKAFKLSGYEVETAFDGEEGLKKLAEMTVKPTLILLDAMMPKMNGFELLTLVKQNSKYAEVKSIPIVLLTNLSGEIDAEKALELGAVLYLVKSEYDPKQVVAKVKELIAGYSRGDSIPEVKVAVKDIKEEK